MNIFLILLLFVSPVMACPANTIDYEGHCADMQPPETAAPVQPSDDVAPNHGGKREAVTVDMPSPEKPPETVSTLINGGVPTR